MTKIELKKYIPASQFPKDLAIDYNDEDIAKAFGMSLRRLRKYKGLTLMELSKAVEVPNPTLSRYESGYNLPSILIGLKIADYFGVGIESMIAAGLLEMYDISHNIPCDKYIEQFADASALMPQFIEALYQAGKKSKHKK